MLKKLKLSLFSGKEKDEVNERLGISRVDDDLIFFKDGSISAVIRLKPSRASEKSSSDMSREIMRFRKFLEDSDMPLQIVARTVNTQVAEQIMIFRANTNHEIMQLENPDSLSRNFNEFCDWIEDYSRKNCAPERQFYMIIKTVPNEGSAGRAKKREKDYAALTHKKSGIILAELARWMHARRLTTSEIFNMLHSYYYLSVYDNKAGEFLDMRRLLEIRGGS